MRRRQSRQGSDSGSDGTHRTRPRDDTGLGRDVRVGSAKRAIFVSVWSTLLLTAFEVPQSLLPSFSVTSYLTLSDSWPVYFLSSPFWLSV
jgi:hypothetical protein